MIKLLGAIILIDLLFSQIELSGYLESEFDAVRSKDSYFYNYHKIRFDMDQGIAVGNTRFSLIGLKYSGKNEFQISDFFEVNPDYDQNIFLRDTLYIENIFVDMFTRYGEFVIGRQPISVGTGYVWNPTDVFNQKNLMDPTYELAAVNSIRWLTSVGGVNSDLIITPDRGGEKLNPYLTLTTTIKRFDVTAALFRYENPETGYLDAPPASGWGFAYSGEVFHTGLWGEFSRKSLTEYPKMYNELVLGMDYTTITSLYFLLEFYRNDSGETWNGGYTDLNILGYLSGESRSLAKNYQMVLASYPVTEFISYSASILKNIDDRSYLIFFESDLNPIEDMDLSLSLYVFEGRKKSEFGDQDISGRVRMTIYF